MSMKKKNSQEPKTQKCSNEDGQCLNSEHTQHREMC